MWMLLLTHTCWCSVVVQVQLAGSQLQYLWGLVCFPLGCVAYISATLVAAALDAKAKADKGKLVAALITSSTTETALQV